MQPEHLLGAPPREQVQRLGEAERHAVAEQTEDPEDLEQPALPIGVDGLAATRSTTARSIATTCRPLLASRQATECARQRRTSTKASTASTARKAR